MNPLVEQKFKSPESIKSNKIIGEFNLTINSEAVGMMKPMNKEDYNNRYKSNNPDSDHLYL